MIDGLLGALRVLLDWPNPAWVLLGVLFGMLIGFLPGMAGSVALALLIPVSFTMDPNVAVLFLIGAYSPAGFGGMLTSILVNTPGAPENAATTFDGYPMAKQGRAGAAIGAATAASVLGGLLGTVVLLALIPAAKRFVLAFSYPEFFAMAILGLTVIAVVTERNTAKGLVAAGVGFLLAFIGLDPITGSPRFTFGQLYLWDGLDIVPVLIGLFAGAEILALFGRGESIAERSAEAGTADTGTADAKAVVPAEDDPDAGDGPVTFWQGVGSAFRHWFLIVRSSLIGIGIGIVPGVGGAVSGFLAYSHAKQTSRHPERFGHGAPEGVISAEAANDAKEGGSLLPTIAFGIPGTVGMAVLLGALIMHGVPAGPTLMTEHSDIVYTLVVGMLAAKLIAPVVVWLVAKQATRLTTLRPGLFTPLIAVAALVGAYTIRLEILDVVLTVVFGYVGYAMHRYGFSRVALIIALVLGELVERSYNQTVEAFGGMGVAFTRPISGTFMVLSVIVVAYAIVQALRRGRSGTRPAETSPGGPGPQWGRVVFDGLLLAFAVAIVVSAWSITTAAATMPLLIGIPVTVGLVLLLAHDLVPFAPDRVAAIMKAVPGIRPRPGREEAARPSAAVVPGVLWRQTAFALWAVGFVVLSLLVGFAASIPLALLFFLLVLAREGWRRSLLVSVGGWLFLYGLFVQMLGVPL